MTRVLVVANVPIRGEALASALRERGFEGESCHGDDVEWALDRRFPDLVVVDIPGAEGRRVARRLASNDPPVAAVALAVEDDEGEILSWIEAGAAGYSSMQDSLDDLVATLRRALAGEADASPRATRALMRRVAALAAAARTAPTELLTDREEEVAFLLQAGLSNKEIAERLSIEVATVKNHVHSILGKLNVRRRGEAVAVIHGRVGQLLSFPPVEQDRKI